MIYDKQLQRELVDSKSPYKFGQYRYVTGGDGDTQMINPFPTLPPCDSSLYRLSFPVGHIQDGKISFGDMTVVACIDQIGDITEETGVSLIV